LDKGNFELKRLREEGRKQGQPRKPIGLFSEGSRKSRGLEEKGAETAPKKD
jgi:hypothetical protein